MILCRFAKAESWPLSVLEYPPFTCESCPGYGANNFALAKALEPYNIQLKFTWLPWSRAIMEARIGRFVGYLPSWPEDCQEDFIFSEVISKSPLGIVERKNHPLKFKNLSELRKYSLGSVQEYGNTFEFNSLVKQGILKTEVVASDVLNVRKVALGRIDGAIIDKNVLRHILNFEHPELKSSLQFNTKILEMKPLGICFRRDKAAELNAKLKVALNHYNTQKIVDEYLKRHFQKASPM